MPIYTNIDGTQREFVSLSENKDGVSTSLCAMYANKDAESKLIFSPEIEVDASTLSAGDYIYLNDCDGKSLYYVYGQDKGGNLYLGRTTPLDTNLADAYGVWSRNAYGRYVCSDKIFNFLDNNETVLSYISSVGAQVNKNFTGLTIREGGSCCGIYQYYYDDDRTSLNPYNTGIYITAGPGTSGALLPYYCDSDVTGYKVNTTGSSIFYDLNQPLFDNALGYELIFRPADKNFVGPRDGDNYTTSSSGQRRYNFYAEFPMQYNGGKIKYLGYSDYEDKNSFGSDFIGIYYRPYISVKTQGLTVIKKFN